MADEMGYQKKLYIGTAGTTAASQVLQATDIDYDLGYDFGNTTVRGAGTSVPIETQNPTTRKAKITWKMIDDPTDARLITLLAAAKDALAVALKLTDGAGNVLFDGDVYIPKKCGAPLKGESTYDFEANPTKSAGRSPTLG
jgi:hypothetical protein